MAFSLDRVALWGRSFGEYQKMFALTEAQLSACILGCGDGPASFNAEATMLGADVTSVDVRIACMARVLHMATFVKNGRT
jgi:hypothetical protein